MPDIDTDTDLNAKKGGGLPRTRVRARLKWFNGPKGFGFLNPEDKPDVDLFLHITVLQKAGFQTLGEGASLLCEIEEGEKGAHVKQIVEILNAGAIPVSPACGMYDPLSVGGQDESHVYEMCGTVKWYKEKEGFGFIVPADGRKDVFIHKSCLDKHGIATLEAGRAVRMRFRTVPKGREAVFLEFLP